MMHDDPLLRAIDKVIEGKRAERQPVKGEQVLTGAIGTDSYVAVRSCYRKREKLQFKDMIFRVRWLQVRDGRWRAGVVECRLT